MNFFKKVKIFMEEYGIDAFKIIAAYEEATDIPQGDRYVDWNGDFDIFEPIYNENTTCDKLLARYNAGLKYLGIIKSKRMRYAVNFCPSSWQSIFGQRSKNIILTQNTVRPLY